MIQGHVRTSPLALVSVGAALFATAAISVAQSPSVYESWDDFRRIADQTDMLRRMAEIGGSVGTYEDFLENNASRPAEFGGHPVTMIPPGAKPASEQSQNNLANAFIIHIKWFRVHAAGGLTWHPRQGVKGVHAGHRWLAYERLRHTRMAESSG